MSMSYCVVNLVHDLALALHESSLTQVDRALARSLGGHRFEYCREISFFSLSHARNMLIFVSPSLKFIIFILSPQS